MTDKAKRDWELVARARDKGDQRAFESLLEIYREPVYYMLLKMTRNTWDADDLTIEAFSKAFRNLDDYTPDFAFSTWLFRIATNNCIDFFRKQKMQMLSMDAEQDGKENYAVTEAKNIIITSSSPEEDMIQEQQKSYIHSVVEKLKPSYRRLVEMRYFEEMSYEEIAQTLQMPLGSVKAKLFRARNLLQEIVRKYPQR
ncbi:MAG: sigma-70 family RNA polymerase sigma factor [Bacteroidales bacterium]|nr:sigma-70 family RNA polymerase sigma factor [Bacteroidales bacterium]